MQSAVLFAGMPGPDRKVACLAYPTSGIPMEAEMADYIRPTLARSTPAGAFPVTAFAKQRQLPEHSGRVKAAAARSASLEATRTTGKPGLPKKTVAHAYAKEPSSRSAAGNWSFSAQ
jgi:hypothetical protein